MNEKTIEARLRQGKERFGMNEKTIEARLRDGVRAMGGKAFKWVSPGNNGVPDRMILMPGGKVCFAELKSPGKKSTALQRARHMELRAMGFTVYADVDSYEKVDGILRGLGQ